MASRSRFAGGLFARAPDPPPCKKAGGRRRKVGLSPPFPAPEALAHAKCHRTRSAAFLLGEPHGSSLQTGSARSGLTTPLSALSIDYRGLPGPKRSRGIEMTRHLKM